MPSLGMLTINALACADSVLIPVQAAYLPVKGLEQLIKTIGRVQRRLNKDLRIEGILLTMVDARTNYAILILDLLKIVINLLIKTECLVSGVGFLLLAIFAILALVNKMWLRLGIFALLFVSGAVIMRMSVHIFFGLISKRIGRKTRNG